MRRLLVAFLLLVPLIAQAQSEEDPRDYGSTPNPGQQGPQPLTANGTIWVDSRGTMYGLDSSNGLWKVVSNLPCNADPPTGACVANQVCIDDTSNQLNWCKAGVWTNLSVAGGATGTLTTIAESNVALGDPDIVVLDFGLGFDLTEAPDAEINVVLDYTEDPVDLSGAEVVGTIAPARVGTDHIDAFTEIADFTGCIGGDIIKRNPGDTAWDCLPDDDSGGTTAIDALGDAGAGDDAVALAEQEQTWTWDYDDGTAAATDGMKFEFDYDPLTADGGTQYGIRISHLDNTVDAVGQMEGLLLLHNIDANDPVTAGLEILSNAGAINVALDVDDPEIVTAIALGDNVMTVDGATLAATELSILDAGTRTDEGVCTYEDTASVNQIDCALDHDLSANSFASDVADPADAGVLRLGNAESIAWEASPTGTDETISLSVNEKFVFSGPIEVDASDPAETGVILLDNSAAISWEASPAGTDVALTADANEIIQITGGSLDADDLSGTVDPGRVGGAHIDLITEIAAARKTGIDTQLVTGTSTVGECGQFNADGDLVGAGAACAAGGNAWTTIGTAGADIAGDTMTITDSTAIDMITADNPEDLSADFVYTNEMVATDIDMEADECVLRADALGGGLVCEGSLKDASEQEYLFPDVNGVDTVSRIAVDDKEVTDLEGTNLSITTGTLNAGDITTATAAVFDITGHQINIDITPGSGNPTLEGTDDALQVKYDTEAFAESGGSGLEIAAGGVDGGAGGDIADNTITNDDMVVNTIRGNEIVDSYAGAGLLETSNVLDLDTTEASSIASGTIAPANDGALVIDTDGDGTNVLNDVLTFQSGGAAQDFIIPAAREYPTVLNSCLVLNTTNDDFEWSGTSCTAAGSFSFDIDGDNNSPQTINDTEEALFVGGAGIDTTAAATRMVTFNLDTTEASSIASGTIVPANDGALVIDTDGDGTNVLHDVLTFQSGGAAEDFVIPAAREYPTVLNSCLVLNTTNDDFEWSGTSCTAGGAGSTWDITDTDASPIQTVDDTEEVNFVGGTAITSVLTPSGSDHDLTISVTTDSLTFDEISDSSAIDADTTFTAADGIELTYKPSFTNSGNFFTIDYDHPNDGDGTDNVDIMRIDINLNSSQIGDTTDGMVIVFEAGGSSEILDSAFKVRSLETGVGRLVSAFLVEGTTVDNIEAAFDASSTGVDAALKMGANVINTATGDIQSTELDRLRGLDAALVDLDDTPTWSGLHTNTNGYTINNSGTLTLSPTTGTAFTLQVENTGDDLRVEANTSSIENVEFENTGTGIVAVFIETSDGNLVDLRDATHLITGSIPVGRVGSSHIDLITEIAAARKTGIDTQLVTGTSTVGECGQFDSNGDLIGSGAACGGGATAWDDLVVPDADEVLAMAAFDTAFNWSQDADTALLGMRFSYDHTDTLSTTDQTLVNIARVNSGAADADIDTLLHIENEDTDDAVTTGILFTEEGGLFTNAIDMVDLGSSVTLLNLSGAAITGLDLAIIDDSQISLTTEVGGTLVVANGGTGGTSFTNGGVLLGNVGGAFQATAAPTNGQLIIGSTGVDPVVGALTAGDGLAATVGAGTLELDLDTTEASSIASGTIVPANDGALVIDTDGDGVNVLNDVLTFQSGGAAEDFVIPAAREYPTVNNSCIVLNATNDDFQWSATDCTVGGGSSTWDITDTDASPIQTVDTTEEVNFIGGTGITSVLTASGSDHDLTLTCDAAAGGARGCLELDNALAGSATDVELAAGVAGNGLTLDTATTPDSLDVFTHTECFTLFDVDGIAATNDIPSVWEAPAAVTVTNIACEADVATDITINLEKDGACDTPALDTASIETGDLQCGTTMTNGVIDVANDNLAAGDCVDLNIVAVTAADRVTICMEYTID